MIWDSAFISKKYLIYLPYKTSKTVQKNSLLKTSVLLLPGAAYILGKTTQLLTRHATFYYASIPQFLWSTVLAFNYHPINCSSNSSSWAFSSFSHSNQTNHPKPTLHFRPPCTSHPPVLCLQAFLWATTQKSTEHQFFSSPSHSCQAENLSWVPSANIPNGCGLGNRRRKTRASSGVSTKWVVTKLEEWYPQQKVTSTPP